MTDLVLFLLAIVVLAGLGIGAYLQLLYNSLVQLNHNVDRAWANVDTLLRQRRDEAARLVEATSTTSSPARGQQLLARLAELRTPAGESGDDSARLVAEQGVSAELDELRAVAEHDPTLRVDPRYLQIQQRLEVLEEQIRHRREFYNQIVTINNARLEQFPDRLVAARAGIHPRAPFVATGEDRADLRVAWDSASATPSLHVDLPSQGSRRPASTPKDRRRPAD